MLNFDAPFIDFPSSSLCVIVTCLLFLMGYVIKLMMMTMIASRTHVEERWERMNALCISTTKEK
jgi:hypothetical protein